MAYSSGVALRCAALRYGVVSFVFIYYFYNKINK